MSTTLEATKKYMLSDPDWQEVWDGFPVSRVIGEPATNLSFGLDDVEHFEGYVDGEHDYGSWVAVGKLLDGRWFVLRGSCCYTGWDCNGYSQAEVAGSKEALYRLAVTPDESESLRR